ncbi:1,4-alpha-glucan branching protein GlgB [Catenulispora sp. NL8]|uniref:1,4-alpha-glucan branching enzyme GlgB n=1 Tax=Catenulispora pinistramenti TaxID=2705254 RepID=A0ABS5L020_9ACTN|nr:1,4-alpha-glucan branching protein GlgB [Catenulispora pinistramenti]MBS2551648.1 1,4-alpha-glucan branching protein GlgB [Catenulispora pinistramenti]
MSWNGGTGAVAGFGGGTHMQDTDTEWSAWSPCSTWSAERSAEWSSLAAPDEPRYWRRYGAQVQADGVRFAVWAPNAQQVNVEGDFNDWNPHRGVELRRDEAGRWSGFSPDARPGDRYKYKILGRDGVWRLKADPVAFASEIPPASASVVFDSRHQWTDDEWMARHRGGERYSFNEPMSVYEVHLGSWRPGLSYDQLAEQLVGHVAGLGFTHVEFLPVMEHPFGGSWGYQTTGFYAPTARLGDPDGLRRLIDAFHRAGIAVILDWVPAHFPRDEWALARFDGAALYEHPDPRRGEHPDWGSLIFDFGHPDVRDFLIGSALYWIEEFHADGLRVDAVSSMLFLDYSRAPGTWEPNCFGGNSNLQALDFIKMLTNETHRRHPSVVMIAEESAAWPGVTRAVQDGGLGFDVKWNLGWMNNTLRTVTVDPLFRRYHFDEIRRPSAYAFMEHDLLPLSHDEVVHGKGSLAGKLPGWRGQQLAGLRGLLAYQWAFPGKQLLFMGGEFGQRGEWSEEWGLDWGSADDGDGVARLMVDLNRLYRAHPALWARDDDPGATHWGAADGDANLISFVRYGKDEDALVCVANFSGGEVRDRRIGLPWGGTWHEVLNTDSRDYDGGGSGNLGAVVADAGRGCDWLPASGTVTVGASGVVWLAGRYGE